MKKHFEVMWGSNKDNTREVKEFPTYARALKFVQRLKEKGEKEIVIDYYDNDGDLMNCYYPV